MTSTELQNLASQFYEIALQQNPNLSDNDKAELCSVITSQFTGVNPSDVITKYIQSQSGKPVVKKLRRGTTIQHSTFTGAIGEITMDTDIKTLLVHDGSTVGGTRLAKYSDIPAPVVLPGYDLDYANAETIASSTVVTASTKRCVLIISCATTTNIATALSITVNGVLFKLYSEYTGTDYPHLSQGYFPIGVGDSYSFSNVQNAIIRRIPYKSV